MPFTPIHRAPALAGNLQRQKQGLRTAFTARVPVVKVTPVVTPKAIGNLNGRSTQISLNSGTAKAGSPAHGK